MGDRTLSIDNDMVEKKVTQARGRSKSPKKAVKKKTKAKSKSKARSKSKKKVEKKKIDINSDAARENLQLISHNVQDAYFNRGLGWKAKKKKKGKKKGKKKK